MYNISAEARQAFLDNAHQNLRISFSDLVLESDNGEIESSGATFTDYFVANENLKFGETPASTFSVSLMNLNNDLAGYHFGEAFVEIGVEVGGSYEYVPMGYYYMEKPSKTQTEVITISDAMDRMRLFEVDAVPFLETLTYPTTVNAIATALYAFVGVTAETQTFTDYTVESNPFPTSCSCREILHWIAERRLCNARINRLGKLEYYWLSDETDEEIPETRIVNNSIDLAEYQTEVVTQSIVKNMAGLSYVLGNPNTNVYYILGNPFIQENEAQIHSFITELPLYVPYAISLTEADPSVDCGDLLQIDTSDEVWALYVTAIGGTDYVLTDDNGVAYGYLTPNIIHAPLLQRTLTWNGICRATYMATGDRIRPLEDETNYSINTANSADGVIEKIRARGIDAEVIKTGTLEGIEIIGEHGSIGGWDMTPEKISKSGTYDVSNVDITVVAVIGAVIKGTFPGGEAAALANYPQADINGDGHINYLDLVCALPIMLEVIPKTGTYENSLKGVNPFSLYEAKENDTPVASSGIHGLFGKMVMTERIEAVDGTTYGSGALLNIDGGYTIMNGKVAVYGQSGSTSMSKDSFPTGLTLLTAPYRIGVLSGGHSRMELSESGLNFYNTSGTLTGSYSSSHSSIAKTTSAPTSFGGSNNTSSSWSGGGSVTPSAGLYYIHAEAVTNGSYASTYFGARILVGGSEKSKQLFHKTDGGTVCGADSTVSCDWVTYLNGSQSIQVQCRHDAANSAHATGYYLKIY